MNEDDTDLDIQELIAKEIVEVKEVPIDRIFDNFWTLINVEKPTPNPKAHETPDQYNVDLQKLVMSMRLFAFVHYNKSMGYLLEDHGLEEHPV